MDCEEAILPFCSFNSLHFRKLDLSDYYVPEEEVKSIDGMAASSPKRTLTVRNFNVDYVPGADIGWIDRARALVGINLPEISFPAGFLDGSTHNPG